MKRIFYVLLFLALSLCVKGQDITPSVKKYDVYCVYYGQLQMNGRVKPQKLIWGDSKKEVKLVSQDGEEIDFKNMVDVVNYMSKRGWRFVDNETFHDRFYVILAKSVTCDDEAKEGLYFNTKNDK